MTRAGILLGVVRPFRPGTKPAFSRAVFWLVCALLATAVPAWSRGEAATEPPADEVCLMCHLRGRVGPAVDAEALKASEHTGLSCTACHSTVRKVPHPEELPPSACGSCHAGEVRDYLSLGHGPLLAEGRTEAETCGDCHGEPHSMIPQSNPDSPINRGHLIGTCGQCHGDEAEDLLTGAHAPVPGAESLDLPVCTDCHGIHLILRVKDHTSPVFHTAVARQCAGCHADKDIVSRYGLRADVVNTYDESFHGLAVQYGSTRAANCVSCHEDHRILPPEDPKSPVNKANLAATCRKCHPGADSSVASGSVHSSPPRSTTPAVRYVAVAYMILIAFTILAMFAYDVLDFLRRALSRVWNRKATRKVYGWRVSQKIQYALLVASFAVLAYTGFALNRPHSWWTAPIRWFDSPSDARALIHRIAAAVLIAVCVSHILEVLLTKRGREQARALRPRLKDFKDLLAQLKYNLGLSKQRPAFGRYNYVEKSEYWTLAWGAVVMTVTGFLLLADNLTLRFLPLWVSELATGVHFFEAVLAGLAAIVWHAYWTVFDSHGHK
ncbi:MAG: cytochrome b/b6 domain-containing protein [Candidatus Eisenbacteria bacterium]|nr:cytochrome b/b6 domain-containing protein [Candidatus Eisenbacteria bacterium]